MGTYSPATRSSRSYQESAIITATPERLVVMLYDGARRFFLQAAAAMREQDVARTNNRLQRGEAIIDELLGTLDMSAGEIAVRLQGLYLFMRRHLTEARIERDPAKIDEVCELLAELREAWAQLAGA